MMIDAFEPALEVLPSGLEGAALAARRGADFTATLLRTRVGRASDVSEANLSGHDDRGAEAVAVCSKNL
jgi:dihydroxyacetone kinase